MDVIFRKDPTLSLHILFTCLQHCQRQKFLLIFNLNYIPLSISYAFPYKLRIFFFVRKSDSFNYLIYFHFEIFSYFCAEIFQCRDFLSHEGQVLRRVPMPLNNWPFPPDSAVTIWPEFLWGTKKHQGVTTLMKCREPCFVVSCLWPHQFHYLL